MTAKPRIVTSRAGITRTAALLAALIGTALVAALMVTSTSSTASAQATSSGQVDDTAGVYLYSAGGDTQGFLTPPPAVCAGAPGSDPTNQTIQIAVDAVPPALHFLGNDEVEVIDFALGDDQERSGGVADSTIADVTRGLLEIDDYGTVANGSDDDANFDAQTGGSVTLQLHVDGAPALIVPDGVASVGVLGSNPADAFANLDGAEIFIFEDAELSGMTVELFGPEGLTEPPFAFAVDDYQRNPDTMTAADDTLIAVDLDSLPGFDFAFVTYIRITDDGIAIVPNTSSCPGGVVIDTSLEIDAVATRTDVVVTEIPSVDIEKDTNGDQADTGPGQNINVGDPVTWTYVVTNTGTLSLTNVAVTDSEGETITCPSGNPIPTLAVGATETCTATGIAAAGAYTNNSTASGQAVDSGGAPFGDPVADTDPSAYTGVIVAAPGVDIEKDTNGDQADTGPGQNINVGGAITWTYVVTNTGNVGLTDVSVSDDQAVTVTCPSGNPIPALATGGVETCTATGVAIAGAYVNTGSASGTPDGGGDPVTDTDRSAYTGVVPAAPSVDIEKDTNGDQADTGPGQNLNVGEAITWTYVVTNTGNVGLTDVSVSDDQAVTVTCPSGNPIPALASGGVEACTATGVAIAGAYVNTGSASGTPDGGGDPVTDSDRSAYTGVPLASLGDFIFVDGNENGIQDTDEPGLAGVEVKLWSANSLGVPIAEIASQTTGADGLYLFDGLTPNESYAVQVVPPAGYRVTAQNAGTDDALDSDADPVTGIIAGVALAAGESNLTLDAGMIAPEPAIDIEKDTNGVQSDTAPGETLTVGDTVTWNYVVTNTGTVDLSDVTVTDDQGVTITCPGGNPIPSMVPAAVVTCTGSGVVIAGAYANMGSASGTPPGGGDVTDEDPSNYTGVPATASLGDFVWDDANSDGIQDPDEAGIGGVEVNLIVVDGNGVESVLASTVTAADGFYKFENLDTSLTYRVQVVPLDGSIVTISDAGTDDNLDSDIDPETGLTPPLTLNPGENDLSIDAGVAPAPASLGDTVWFDENSNGIQDAGEPGIVGAAVKLWTVDADGNPGAVLRETSTIAGGRYIFANLDSLIDYIVEFDIGAAYTLTDGDVGDDDTIDSDASVSSGLSPIIDLGRGEENLTIDAGVLPLVADIEVVKTTSGAMFTVGDDVTWTYVVTNTGDVDLIDVTVTDDIEGDVCEIATLDVGESETCTKTGVAVAGNYENTATATGTPTENQPDGSTIPPPTDEDPSNYEGTSVLPTTLPTTTPGPTSTPAPTATARPTATPRPAPLAITGSDSGSQTLLAISLVMVGAAFVVLGRRRETMR